MGHGQNENERDCDRHRELRNGTDRRINFLSRYYFQVIKEDSRFFHTSKDTKDGQTLRLGRGCTPGDTWNKLSPKRKSKKLLQWRVFVRIPINVESKVIQEGFVTKVTNYLTNSETEKWTKGVRVWITLGKLTILLCHHRMTILSVYLFSTLTKTVKNRYTRTSSFERLRNE